VQVATKVIFLFNHQYKHMCFAAVGIASDLYVWGQVMLELLKTEVCGSSTDIYLPVLGFLLHIEEEEMINH
jgi:hypothetical protein